MTLAQTTPTGADGLSITSSNQLTDEDRQAIRDHKAELLDLPWRREADMRSHPCNAAALWHLIHRTRRVAPDGSLIVEDVKRRRLEADDLCSAYDRDRDGPLTYEPKKGGKKR